MERLMQSEETDVALTKATANDREFLLHVRKQTMVEHLEQAGIFLSEAEHALRLDDLYECSYVLWHLGERVGHVKFRESLETLEVMQLQILPEHQGKGVGGKLMCQLIEKVEARSRRIVLSVLKRNPAKRLYERMGFQVTGEDEHEFHMVLPPRGR